MSFLFSALGTIFGTLYFALTDSKILVAALVSFIASSVVFTTFKHRRIEILSFLVFFLLCFFNYNIRSEVIEFSNLEKYISEHQSEIYFQVSSPPKDKILTAEFIVDIKNKNPSLKNKLNDYFLPKRFLAKTSSTQGLEEGDIIELSGNYNFEKLTNFDYRINKKNKCFYQIKNVQITFKHSGETIFSKAQKTIKEYFYKHLDKENAAITSSLILGAKTASPPERFTKISYKLGIGHFLAASGFQLVVLGFLVNFIFKAFRAPIFITNSITIILVFIYAALAGFSPSILRATVCTIVFLLLQMSKRKLDSKKFITILAGMVLFIDPYTIFDLGFQFSYLATLAILCWTKYLEEKLNFIKFGFIKEAIAITLSVQFFLLPLSVYYFGNLQIWSILANIFLTPILTLITLLGFFGLTPLLEPLLNLTKYLIYNSEQLPWINSGYDLNFTSMLLLTLTLNLLGFMVFQPKLNVPSDEDFVKKIHQRYSDENIFILIKKISSDRNMQLALMISCLSLLAATNFNPINTISLRIENGLIYNYPELTEFMQSKNKNYQYFDYQGIKILVIKKRSSTKALGALVNDLHEVDILILPKLNQSDIYLNTLVDITKPQFIICSINKTQKDKNQRVSENIKIMGSKANTIIDSGVIYISKGKFWNLSK